MATQPPFSRPPLSPPLDDVGFLPSGSSPSARARWELLLASNDLRTLSGHTAQNVNLTASLEHRWHFVATADRMLDLLNKLDSGGHLLAQDGG